MVVNLPHSHAGTADETQIADAIRWLRRSYRVGAVVDAVATVGTAPPNDDIDGSARLRLAAR